MGLDIKKKLKSQKTISYITVIPNSLVVIQASLNRITPKH